MCYEWRGGVVHGKWCDMNLFVFSKTLNHRLFGGNDFRCSSGSRKLRGAEADQTCGYLGEMDFCAGPGVASA